MLEQTKTILTKDFIKIKVLGIGGGGNNAVNQMINTDIYGAEYILVNTEKGILDRANTNEVKTLQIGKEVAKGLGAGANPDVGEKSAVESTDEIDKILEGAVLVFLTAGMRRGNRDRCYTYNCIKSKTKRHFNGCNCNYSIYF